MSSSPRPSSSSAAFQQGVWTQDEHDRFLEALREYPQGPWKEIAQFVGTRSVRQVQTHAQKYNEKVQRRRRGPRKDRKTWARLEHRIDDNVLTISMKKLGGATCSASDRDHTETTFSSSSSWRSSSDPQETRDSLEEHFAALGWEDHEAIAFPSLNESLDFLIECLGPEW